MPSKDIVNNTAQTESNQQEAVGLVQLRGVVKWFDVTKGYGFIVSDEADGDILLHITCLRRDGFEIASEGDRIVCEAFARDQGLQAFRIISLESVSGSRPRDALESYGDELVKSSSDLEAAEVKWFNRSRGFGFLTQSPDSDDIFVHMKTLRRFGINELSPGQRVFVRYGRTPKGRMVAEIHTAGPASIPTVSN